MRVCPFATVSVRNWGALGIGVLDTENPMSLSIHARQSVITVWQSWRRCYSSTSTLHGWDTRLSARSCTSTDPPVFHTGSLNQGQKEGLGVKQSDEAAWHSLTPWAGQGHLLPCWGSVVFCTKPHIASQSAIRGQRTETWGKTSSSSSVMGGGIQCRFTYKSSWYFNYKPPLSSLWDLAFVWPGSCTAVTEAALAGSSQPRCSRNANTPLSSRHGHLITALPKLVCSNFSQRRGFMRICYPASVDKRCVEITAPCGKIGAVSTSFSWGQENL